MSENRFSIKFEQNINSAINFRRVTHFRLCLLETQVIDKCHMYHKIGLVIRLCDNRLVWKENNHIERSIIHKKHCQSSTTRFGGRKVEKEEKRWETFHFCHPEPLPNTPAAYVWYIYVFIPKWRKKEQTNYHWKTKD